MQADICGRLGILIDKEEEEEEENEEAREEVVEDPKDKEDYAGHEKSSSGLDSNPCSLYNEKYCQPPAIKLPSN